MRLWHKNRQSAAKTGIFCWMTVESAKEINMELPEDLQKEVEADPYYFVYQGGSDGTFSHIHFLNNYGEWADKMSKYAAQILTERGEDW